MTAEPERRYRALDLFCGAGGATRGLQLAGFHVTGVDISPQPRYVGDEFIQADVRTLDACLLADFDLIWASPPCQPYTRLGTLHDRARYPALVPWLREWLWWADVPASVIENVPGAPLAEPIMLCGEMFGLGVYRHRLFECAFPILAPPHVHRHNGRTESGKGANAGARRRAAAKVTVTGHAFHVTKARQAMGIEWMTAQELAQAIPPAYARFIGEQARRLLERSDGRSQVVSARR